MDDKQTALDKLHQYWTNRNSSMDFLSVRKALDMAYELGLEAAQKEQK